MKTFAKSVATVVLAMVTGSVQAAPPAGGPAAAPGGTPFRALSDKLDRNLAAIEEESLVLQGALHQIRSSTHWVSPHWGKFIGPGYDDDTIVYVLNLDPVNAVDLEISWWREEGDLRKLSVATLPPRRVRVFTTSADDFCAGLGSEFPGSCRGWVEIHANGGAVLVDGYIRFSEGLGRPSEETRRTMTWYPLGTDRPGRE